MKCHGCGAELGRILPSGEPMLRTRGLIMKAQGVTAVCPKCKTDVPVVGVMAKALSARLLLVMPSPPKQPKRE